MKQYRIHYKQKFGGEILENSYIRTVDSERDLIKIEDALFDDPHVFSVHAEKISNEMEAQSD